MKLVFLQTTASYPYRKLAIKRGTFFISNTEYKIRKFLLIHHKLINLFVHLMSIMPGIKEVKHSTKTASSGSKSENLYGDPM